MYIQIRDTKARFRAGRRKPEALGPDARKAGSKHPLPHRRLNLLVFIPPAGAPFPAQTANTGRNKITKEPMAVQNQVFVTSDPARNLLQCALAGDIGPKEIAHYGKAVEEALATLSSGFHVLVDLTDLNTMDLGSVPYIQKAMELCRSRGVARIVRIIPDQSKDIGFGIMSLFHYPHEVQIITCKTRAEAIGALE